MKTVDLKSGTKLPLINLKGKDYLAVAYRLVWFRQERPLWSIETEFPVLTDKNAFARATIKDEHGRIIATAHKEESLADFPAGFREKAETGAIGRALGLIGYGTQYEPEFDEGERVVDSPIGSGGIHPENPEPGDGFAGDKGYAVPFGKWAKRSLEEIPFEELKSYVVYIETKSQKDNKPIQGQVLDFLKRATDYIGSIENSGLSYNPEFDRER